MTLITGRVSHTTGLWFFVFVLFVTWPVKQLSQVTVHSINLCVKSRNPKIASWRMRVCVVGGGCWGLWKCRTAEVLKVRLSSAKCLRQKKMYTQRDDKWICIDTSRVPLFFFFWTRDYFTETVFLAFVCIVVILKRFSFVVVIIAGRECVGLHHSQALRHYTFCLLFQLDKLDYIIFQRVTATKSSPKEGGSRKERKELGCVAGLAVYCMSAFSVSSALPQATTHFFPSAPTLLLWVSLCPLTYSGMSPKKKKKIQCVCACQVPRNPQNTTWWQNCYLTLGREETRPLYESWHCPCRRYTCLCVSAFTALCDWEKNQRDWQREKGTLYATRFANQTIKVSRGTVLRVSSLLPPSANLLFHLPLPPPSSSPPPRLCKWLNSEGRFSPDGLDSLRSCCGHVTSSSSNLCICVPQHPSVYHAQPAVCAQLPPLQLFVCLPWISVWADVLCVDLVFLYNSVSLRLQTVCP